MFPDRLISLSSNINWSRISRDLTVLDYFVSSFGKVKSVSINEQHFHENKKHQLKYSLVLF